MGAKAAADPKGRSNGTATQPARKALAKKPAPSIISTAAPGPGRKRKVPDIVEDLDGPKHPSKTRRTRGPAPVSRAAQKPQSRTAQRALAPLRVLNTAPAQVLTVFAFGTGDCGELGLGPKERGGPRPLVNRFLDPTDGFRAVQLACGGMHVVALTSNNEIVTWGVNDKGALGRDTDWEEPLRDMDAESSDEDDDHLNPLESTPTAVPSDSFPPGTVFVQVAAGDSCTLALTNTGLVYAWGSFANSEGKFGFCYDSAGQLIEVQHRPYHLSDLKDITQITCGANHALALDASGTVWAWGIGEQAQLGRRLGQRRAPLGLAAPQRVEVCRNNATYIASGQYHSFAVDGKDNVWAWGLNSFGEAGNANGSSTDSGSLPYPMKIPGLCGQGVVMLDGGAHHSVAVTADGRCFVWGRIDGGQLGVEFGADQLADQTLIVRDGRDRPRICTRPVAVAHIGEGRTSGALPKWLSAHYL